jgi:hypothetical protein
MSEAIIGLIYCIGRHGVNVRSITDCPHEALERSWALSVIGSSVLELMRISVAQGRLFCYRCLSPHKKAVYRFYQRAWPTHLSRSMSTSGAVTALFTATVAQAPRPGVEPEDVAEKKHHLKDGKGFINPWESWREMPASKILWSLLK